MQEQAEGYKAKVIGDAQGNTARFTSILGEYEKAPAVMRQRMYLESMQEIFTRASKVMVDTKSNNNMLYLPWTRSCTWPPRTPQVRRCRRLGFVLAGQSAVPAAAAQRRRAGRAIFRQQQ